MKGDKKSMLEKNKIRNKLPVVSCYLYFFRKPQLQRHGLLMAWSQEGGVISVIKTLTACILEAKQSCPAIAMQARTGKEDIAPTHS